MRPTSLAGLDKGMQFRKIAVMTGTRAEYGLMSWLIDELCHSDHFVLQLVVSGMHLSPLFGHTVSKIIADGYEIAAEVPCVGLDDSPIGMIADFSEACSGFGRAFETLKPDILVLLGDRYEALAAACAATMLRIPIAHIHGGEATEGAMDEAFRHSITKMAHLHFPAAEDYARRIVRMGEDPERVHMVGAIGLDSFTRLDLMPRPALAAEFDLDTEKPWVLVTFHPATLEEADAAEQTKVLVAALDRHQEAVLMVTKANSDPGGRAVNQVWENQAAANPDRVRLFDSLGQTRYLSAMKQAAAVVGNSSSGIIEAPAAGVPTVNIGSRQAGRLMADTILHARVDANEISTALERALSGEKIGGAHTPPYGKPNDATGKILKVLGGNHHDNLLIKKFYEM